MLTVRDDFGESGNPLRWVPIVAQAGGDNVQRRGTSYVGTSSTNLIPSNQLEGKRLCTFAQWVMPHEATLGTCAATST